MPVLDEAFMREIEEDMRRSQAALTISRSDVPSPGTPPALNLPTLNLDLIENNPPPVPQHVNEDDSDEKETFGMDEGLEPPSYNPLLD
jgi:hypothetical protein